MAIKPLKKVYRKEFKKLNQYQSGTIVPIKTNREWLDEIFGGLLPKDIVVIAGASGGGKSFELQRLKNTIMDKEVNEPADDFVWLDYSLEMKTLSLIIRDLNKKLNKSKKKILLEAFSDDEKELVADYYKTMTDGRYYIEEEATTPSEFEENTSVFLEKHKNKEAVFISLDHIALQKNEGPGKKDTIDRLVESINIMKKKYPNSYWFILSQLNREILKRINEADALAMPNRGDIYQSDTMFFIADYLYVTHNPHRLGIKQFSKVNAKTYEYLEEYFGPPDNKGRVSFDSLGKIFYIVLKMREAEIMFKDIFIEEIDIGDRSKYEEQFENQEVTSSAILKFVDDDEEDDDIPF